ncbi:MAG: flavodoxin family protein [Candidatus Brockarchaeota archaeon]|nr:flavodoxin family protein [Candidatus Brockarchaeota archaeon]MBO3808876.1 flavodoxin family protein [Candidatus Brockarchaeota archaeon]
MKTLIIYVSMHHGNTEKIAKAIAGVLEADLATPAEVDADTVSKHDLIGFGSGIYFLKHHPSIFSLVERLPSQNGRAAFIFSTSGLRRIRLLHDFDNPLRKSLLAKGFRIIGEFNCRGWDTYPVWVKPFGGINKGKPGEKELKEAELFAISLKKYFKAYLYSLQVGQYHL